MTDALHVGPILLGTAKPAHILTPSVTSRGVVNMTALAVVEAAHKAQATQCRRERVRSWPQTAIRKETVNFAAAFRFVRRRGLTERPMAAGRDESE